MCAEMNVRKIVECGGKIVEALRKIVGCVGKIVECMGKIIECVKKNGMPSRRNNGEISKGKPHFSHKS